MKVSIWENGDWRNVSRARVQLTQAELTMLYRSGVDAYRLAGVEVVVCPDAELGSLEHREIDG